MLNKTELSAMESLATGTSTVKGIAKAIRKSRSQAYRCLESLSMKSFVALSRNSVTALANPHAALLMQLLAQYPNLKGPLSDSGMPIIASLIQKGKTVEGIANETRLKKPTVYRKIQQMRKASIVRKTGKLYEFNGAVWPTLKEFIEAYDAHGKATDPRVPVSSAIYSKSEKEIVFSTPLELDAAPTAFSAYKGHGIKIVTSTNFYRLPKKRLSIREIFAHSLSVAERTGSARDFIAVSIFYIKHRKKLGRISHPLLKVLSQILKGKNIEGYPSLDEIREKASDYDIRV